MNNSNLKTKLAQATALSILFGGFTLPGALAQDETSAPESDARQETIIVTGSRIARTDLLAASPVNTVTAEAFDIAGATNLQDIVNELPSAGVPGLTDTSSNFTLNGGGVNFVNLRNLGDERTLVLVNGRRHVGGLAGDPTVDLNMIPSALIERVDIVTGGGSAVYGSEAIAGVVNIIYKDDFEGVETNLRYGESIEGGASETDFNILAGSDFADGRGNAVVYLGVSDSGQLSASQREISESDATNSSFGPFSSFQIPGGGFITLDRDTGLFDKDFVNSEDGFDRNAVRLIRVPTDRLQFASNLDYQVNDYVNFFAEASYNQVESYQQLEPTIMGQFISVGSVPDVNMPVDNPFLPDELRAAILAADPDATEVTFRRRFTELGPRTTDQQRQTFRYVAGLEGTAPDEWGGFDWEVYYQNGRQTQDRVNGGIANTLNVYNALRTEPDPANPGEFRCEDEISRSLGCVPVNFFGTGTVDGAALDFIQTTAQTTSRAVQEVFGATITGQAFELPTGSIGYAFGAEYRSEESDFVSDGLAATGLTTGNTSPSVRGYYDVTEYFGEVLVPILSEQPFFHELSFEGAYRVADYSTIGTTDSYKASLLWKPVNDLTFRGGVSTATRAPNIGELFDPGSETFRTFEDPCNFGGAGGASADGLVTYAAQSSTVQANCATYTGSATLDQGAVNIRSAGGFQAGNPDLTEETAKTKTIGFVYSPSQIPGLNITVDYYDILVEDAIDTFTAQDTVDQCVRQPNFPDNPFCGLIQRDPNTALVLRIDALEINVSELKAEGVDFAVDYTTEIAGIDWYGALIANHTMEDSILPFAGGDIVDDAGEVGSPEWSFNTQIVANYDKWRVAWSSRWIDQVNIDNENPSAGPADAGGKIDSFWYHDINVNYEVNETFDVAIGIDNLFDEIPPLLGQGTNGDVTGTNTASDVYDVLGRYAYVNLRARF
ncbi:MAG: TonB-dependent receptor domain-containing protein [Henriciella sp.]